MRPLINYTDISFHMKRIDGPSYIERYSGSYGNHSTYVKKWLYSVDGSYFKTQWLRCDGPSYIRKMIGDIERQSYYIDSAIRPKFFEENEIDPEDISEAEALMMAVHKDALFR